MPRWPTSERAGLQHRVSSEYFARISALDFATAHDDGALGRRLLQADVVLTGVSRTSKTPTCIYLAYRGIRAANVPLLPKSEPDPALFAAIEAGVPVIGLTASPTRLAQIRSQRLAAMGAGHAPDYADLGRIRGEVAEARLFFDRHEIPVIDVTTRSIEETAAAILVILRSRGRADL
jgi:[pyruvate, water dikinase]-phosphate phosphotransferase / [pyruvate, water dikinase] kinase